MLSQNATIAVEDLPESVRTALSAPTVVAAGPTAGQNYNAWYTTGR